MTEFGEVGLPSFCMYNLNWMSLCDQTRRNAKIHLLRDILRKFEILGVSELHANSTAEADLFFVDHLECERFYDTSANLVILVRSAWAEEHRQTLRHHSVVPGAVHAISWVWGGRNYFLFNIYLDASSDPSIKAQQLTRAKQWTACHVQRGDLCFFGGDRNHTRDPAESMVYHGVNGERSPVRSWAVRRPQFSVLEAWDAWMGSMYGGYIVDQPEFTFKRKCNTGFYCSVLDVVGSNVDAAVYDCKPSCATLPTPDTEATDHSPLGLRWTPIRRHRRGGRRGAASHVRKPIPAWLLQDAAFCVHLDRVVHSWLSSRGVGGEGLLEFVDICYDTATKYLRGHLIEAVTTQHQLSVTLHLLREIQSLGRQPNADGAVCIPFELLQRSFSIYPALKTLVEVTIDTVAGTVAIVISPLQQHASELLASLGASAAQTTSETTADTGSLLTQRWHSNLFRDLKESLPKEHTPELQELLDPDTGQATADRDDMVRIIKDAAFERQGVDSSDPTAGEELLRDWGVDLSECRTLLLDVEVEAIILGAPGGKKPGPDGIPAEFSKRYAKELALVFQEAWSEMLSGSAPASFLTKFGQRKWVVIPKTHSANTTDKLRDLEMCNSTRKTLSRMTNKVLDEVFKTKLCPAQQAFYSGGDISRNLVKMHTIFRDAQYTRTPPAGFAYSAPPQQSSEGVGQEGGAANLLEELLIILSSDCSKGYNRLGWSWIRRCLKASKLPASLIILIELFLPGTVHLMFGGETESLSLESGLAQGDPLSCFVFILSIDPLLWKLQSLPGVVGVTGFVDDWNTLCRGIRALEACREVFRVFEQASGQRINVGKSGLIPAAKLSPEQVTALQAIWQGIQIFYNTRVLGLQIGIDADLDSQYARPLAKFTARLSEFQAMQRNLSTSMRIAVINVFLYSLFSFVNRFFYMPERLLNHVQNAALAFISPIKYATIHFFSHLKRLYGIHGVLRDLRNSNVAAVLATYVRVPENTHHLSESLALIAQQRQDRKITGPLVHPAHSWLAARAYFRFGTHTEPDVFYECALPKPERLAKLDLVLPSKQKVLYAGLQQAEFLQCKRYLLARVQGINANTIAFLEGLEHACTLKTTQSQRWHLLKIHLNGHVTSQRRHHEDSTAEPTVAPCLLCGSAWDSTTHLLACPPVSAALQLLAADGSPVYQGTAVLRDFFFCPGWRRFFELKLAIFSATWAARGTMIFGRRGAVTSRERLPALIAQGVAQPWLLGTPSATRQERRAARVRSPSPVPRDVGQYAGDGARAQGEDNELATGWGAVFWTPGQDTNGPPSASANGVLEEPSTGNMGEMQAMLQILTRASHQRCQKVVIDMDSMLVVNYMNGIWACHRKHLLEPFQKCRDLISRLRATGCDLTIRHVYREYNRPADAAAGEAIQAPHAAGPSLQW